MKILLIGPGSIGLRHLHNIVELGYHSVSIVSRSGHTSESFSHLPVFASVSDALSGSLFDAAIVCTPTAFHISALMQLLEAKVPNIYIEKPISHSLNGLPELAALYKMYDCNLVVGYDLHFDPGIQQVKQLLEQGTLGKVISVNAQVGQYLPDWRPHQDYRSGMSASKETGGGVMLDLVHEFDYLLWLFGKVKLIACQYATSGALDIETEDVCDVLLRFESGATGTIHLDYLQPTLVRNCMITCYGGTIYWNLANSSVRWITKDKKEEEFSYKGYERNDRFKEIIKVFLERKKDTRLTTLHQGIESLQLVIAAKHAAENLIFVNPETFCKLPSL